MVPRDQWLGSYKESSVVIRTIVDDRQTPACSGGVSSCPPRELTGSRDQGGSSASGDLVARGLIASRR